MMSRAQELIKEATLPSPGSFDTALADVTSVMESLGDLERSLSRDVGLRSELAKIRQASKLVGQVESSLMKLQRGFG